MKKRPSPFAMRLCGALLLDAAVAAATVGGVAAYLCFGNRTGNGLQIETAAARQFSDRPWEAMHEGRLSDPASETADAWHGPSCSVEISSHSSGEGTKHALAWYVADVKVSDVRCIRTAFAGGRYGSQVREELEDIARRENAVVAVNGDFYGYQAGGLAIRNGVAYRNEPADGDACVLFADGELRAVPAGTDLRELARRGAWQAWTFGPSLLDENGKARPDKASKSKYLRRKHPRTAIGYYRPGHYCFVVVDGRREGYSEGATLERLARIMEELGCRAAYNLDGGMSSSMVFRGATRSRPPDTEPREIQDAVMACELATEN